MYKYFWKENNGIVHKSAQNRKSNYLNNFDKCLMTWENLFDVGASKQAANIIDAEKKAVKMLSLPTDVFNC